MMELQRLYGAYFRAIGLDTGAAGEATQMVLWMDLHGFEGFGRLCNKVRGMAKSKHWNEYGSKLTWVTLDNLIASGGGASLLTVGPIFVDLAVSNYKTSNCSRAVCKGFTDIAFAVSLGSVVLSRNASCILKWSDEEREFVVTAHQQTLENSIEVRYRDISPGVSPTRGCIKAIFGAEATTTTDRSQSECWSVMPAPVLCDNRNASWLSGKFVDADGWELLSQIAKRLLVPESEKSRLRGAGIGADGD